MDAPHPDIPELASIATLAAQSDVWFVDIWGVLHNGVRPYACAVEACRKFRDGGGAVILVSNSPRPCDGVVKQLNDVGVAAAAYDGVVTSGDVTRNLIAGWSGRSVYHIGPERDLPLFEGSGVVLSAPDAAEAIVCTGLFDDETETPADYEDMLALVNAFGVPMICANPDITVERGGRIIYCAGALAMSYAAIGGEVLTAGKPHRPIYDAAMALAAKARGGDVDTSRVLAIGDGVKTDIAGASAYGLKSVFVASAVDVRAGEALTDAARRLFAGWTTTPIAAMRALAW